MVEQLEVQLIFELADVRPGMRVLDVGSGDGTYALEAAARGARVTAVEPDPQMRAAAQDRAAAQGLSVAWCDGQAENLPFLDGTFDLVLAVTVLCLVAEPATAAQEMARVLAPGGRLVVGELHRYSAWAASRRLRGLLGALPWRHSKFWSSSELIHVARNAGLRAGRVRGAIHFLQHGFVARVVAPVDPLLSRLRFPGAAFLALTADKPR